MYKASVTTKRYDGERNRVSIYLDESVLEIFHGGTYRTSYDFKTEEGHSSTGVALVHIQPSFDYVHFELRIDLSDAGWSAPFLSWFSADAGCSREMSSNIFRYLQSIAYSYGFLSEVYEVA